jgi:hypothetical protein
MSVGRLIRSPDEWAKNPVLDPNERTIAESVREQEIRAAWRQYRDAVKLHGTCRLPDDCHLDGLLPVEAGSTVFLSPLTKHGANSAIGVSVHCRAMEILFHRMSRVGNWHERERTRLRQQTHGTTLEPSDQRFREMTTDERQTPPNNEETSKVQVSQRAPIVAPCPLVARTATLQSVRRVLSNPRQCPLSKLRSNLA